MRRSLRFKYKSPPAFKEMFRRVNALPEVERNRERTGCPLFRVPGFDLNVVRRLLQKAIRNQNPELLTSAGNRVVSVFGADEQARQSARRSYLYLDLMPAAVVGEIDWFVPDRILMAEFEGNLLENVIHFSIASGEECFATGNTGEFVQNPLAFHTHLAAGIAATKNADPVKRDV